MGRIAQNDTKGAVIDLLSMNYFPNIEANLKKIIFESILVIYLIKLGKFTPKRREFSRICRLSIW